MFNLSMNFNSEEILIYLRKSRSDDPLQTVDEVLAKHEAILDEWVENNIGSPVPEQNRFREVVSGETINDRPQMLALLKEIESPRIKAILAVEVERLSRGDLEDAGRLIKLLRYTNTCVITPMKTFDLSNDYDRSFFERDLKRGNEYLEYSKKILNRGRLLSVSQGNYIGSLPPYGYDKIWITDGKKKYPTLKINEEEAATVRMIFDLYVNEDMGRTNICHKLNELGLKPKYCERWNSAVIKDMLTNIHYIGKIKWDWRKSFNIVEDGQIREVRPRNMKADYIKIYDGKHPAIISEELFEAAQAKRGRNSRKKSTTKTRNPLAGLLYCQCGRAMSYRTYVRHGVVGSSPRLLCDDQVYCHTKSCLYSSLLDMVINILEENIRDFEIQLHSDNSESIDAHKELIHTLNNKIRELEKKELNLWDKYSEEGMPRDIFDKLHQKVLSDKEQARASLQKAINTLPAIDIYEEQIERFTNALEALKDDNVTAATKNKLLKACIERITYSRNPEISLDVTLRL